MTTAPVQSLAHGSPSKYGRLGGHTARRMMADPHGILAFIAGPPNTGKSALLQSNPDAFIFNLDISSTVIADPVCTLWPGISPEGRAIGDDGKPVFLDWPAVLSKITILEELARAGQPRPRTVVFDSITTVIRLLREHVVANAKSLALATSDKNITSWRQLEGRSAWDTVYDLFIGVMTRLHSLGYGIYVVGHIVNAKIPLNENQTVFRPELTLGPGFWSRLFPVFELVGITAKSIVVENVQVDEPLVINGQTKINKRTISRSRVVYSLGFSDPAYMGIVKSRNGVPSVIELPETGAWPHFVQRYTESTTQGHKA